MIPNFSLRIHLLYRGIVKRKDCRSIISSTIPNDLNLLIAADTFSSMLSAYRSHLQPPSGEELRQQILSLTSQPANRKPQRLQGRFAWSEYEQMVIDEALDKGETVINVAFAIDPQCPMRGAAMQLIRNVLQECGRLLAIVPDQSTLAADVDVVPSTS